VRFRAQVVDARGCPLSGRNVAWNLVAPQARSAELRGGVFTAAEAAAEAEGEFTVVARSGSMEARAEVRVRTADLSDLIAKRTSGGVVQAADDDDASSDSAAGLVARRADGGGSLLWPALGAVALLVVLGGVLALVFARRKRSGEPDASRSVFDEAAPVRSAPAAAGARSPVASARAPGAPRTCPVCHKEFEDPTVGFCPADGAQLVDAAAPPPATQALVCPTCRRGFGEGVRVCPTDQDELVPYALFVQRHRAREAGVGEKTKICPKCGDRYALTVTFCGKDGSELVLVN
jgi:hypothetical protein